MRWANRMSKRTSLLIDNTWQGNWRSKWRDEVVGGGVRGWTWVDSINVELAQFQHGAPVSLNYNEWTESWKYSKKWEEKGETDQKPGIRVMSFFQQIIASGKWAMWTNRLRRKKRIRVKGKLPELHTLRHTLTNLNPILFPRVPQQVCLARHFDHWHILLA